MTKWQDMREFFIRGEDGTFRKGYGHFSQWVTSVRDADAVTLGFANEWIYRTTGGNKHAVVYPGPFPTISLSPDDTQKVISGDKVLTVRLGLRDYGLGDAFLHDRENGIVIPITILRTSHCELRHVPQMDLVLCGHRDHESHLAELRDFYPNMMLDDPVTVVRFDLRKDEEAVKPKIKSWDVGIGIQEISSKVLTVD